MKKYLLLLVLFAIYFITPGGSAYASDYKKLLSEAMESIAVTKGDSNIGVLTNANYVTLAGKTTEQYVDQISETTGCTIGKRNLLFVNKRPQNELITCLINRTTRKVVVIRFDGAQSSKGSLSLLEKDLNNSEFYSKAKKGISGKDAFSIVTIISAWLNDAPQELIRSGEYHGHICPGLLYGYALVKEYVRQYPLGKSEKYYYYASPNRCKDDAVGMMLGLTPGNKNFIAKKLEKDPIHSANPDKRALGILVKWSTKEKKGIGSIMTLAWKGIKTISGADLDLKPNEKIPVANTLLKNIDILRHYVNFEKEFVVDSILKERLSLAGYNPYEVLKVQ